VTELMPGHKIDAPAHVRLALERDKGLGARLGRCMNQGHWCSATINPSCAA